MATTKISWCSRELPDGRILDGYTCNPWRGCSKVSQGCKFCYAESMSGRNHKLLGIWGPQGTRTIAAESYWRQFRVAHELAESEQERRFVFCASLADVFEGRNTMPKAAWEAVEAQRTRLFTFIKHTPWLCWLLLTKRPENIKAMLPDDWGDGYPNAWLGTSVEDQDAADARIQTLIDVPATRRFLSCEPLIGRVRFKDSWLGEDAISWIICGGESGSVDKIRPMQEEWARSMRNQCELAGVDFFMKQFGTLWAKAHDEPGKAHDIETWPLDLQVQQQPHPGYPCRCLTI